MIEFLEFFRAHPWEVGLVLYAVASGSAILGYLVASSFADYRETERKGKT